MLTGHQPPERPGVWMTALNAGVWEPGEIQPILFAARCD